MQIAPEKIIVLRVQFDENGNLKEILQMGGQFERAKRNFPDCAYIFFIEFSWYKTKTASTMHFYNV